MINFSKIACDSLTDNSFGTTIMSNRSKLTTDKIIVDHLDHLTIIQFDVLTSKQGSRYSVVNFVEYPDHYYCGGQSLTNICDQWIEAYEGDLTQANMDLKEAGGCKIKIEKVRTSKGNPFVKVTIIH